jgi:hypothetical protein
MHMHEDVEYTVVLVTSGFGEERENAEQVIEEALAYLNTFREEPGFRFAPYVTAHLEIVSDIDDARARMEGDDSVAMMILHDQPDDERRAFTEECNRQDVAVCRTVPAPDRPVPRPRPKRPEDRAWKIVFRKRSDDDEPHAHQIPDTTLSASLDCEEEELILRVQQLIAVMALGVMQYHFKKNPPRFSVPE